MSDRAARVTLHNAESLLSNGGVNAAIADGPCVRAVSSAVSSAVSALSALCAAGWRSPPAAAAQAQPAAFDSRDRRRGAHPCLLLLLDALRGARRIEIAE